MYGKIPERKLKEADYILSCQATRKELEQYIDSENRRVNVDSAKKLAVLQHMDYEGFRQMVLGANIFPTKAKELNEFSMGNEEKQTIPNKIFVEKKSEALGRQSKEIEGNSEKHCFNFRDFKKKFNKHYEKELTLQMAEQCYSLTKQQNKTRLEKIFNLECEPEIILKIIEVFKFVIGYLLKESREQTAQIECRFMISFLRLIFSISTMQDISLNILTKKQKEKAIEFLEACKVTLKNGQEQASISQVIALIRK